MLFLFNDIEMSKYSCKHTTQIEKVERFYSTNCVRLKTPELRECFLDWVAVGRALQCPNRLVINKHVLLLTPYRQLNYRLN
jgi:hypothetical protein